MAGEGRAAPDSWVLRTANHDDYGRGRLYRSRSGRLLCEHPAVVGAVRGDSLEHWHRFETGIAYLRDSRIREEAHDHRNLGVRRAARHGDDHGAPTLEQRSPTRVGTDYLTSRDVSAWLLDDLPQEPSLHKRRDRVSFAHTAELGHHVERPTGGDRDLHHRPWFSRSTGRRVLVDHRISGNRGALHVHDLSHLEPTLTKYRLRGDPLLTNHIGDTQHIGPSRCLRGPAGDDRVR